MNQITSSISEMTSGNDTNLQRPFSCEKCSKSFTRSVNAPSSLSSWLSFNDIIYHRKIYSDIIVPVSLHPWKKVLIINKHIDAVVKATAVFPVRTFGVPDVMLAFLEATYVNGMSSAVGRQDLRRKHPSRRFSPRICMNPTQWLAECRL
ncbi:hypothetical protein N7454_007262 [Penicillium verhagenii]|nr:hypothetical protein N7454_007262 [Penicillium verhagenii]